MTTKSNTIANAIVAGYSTKAARLMALSQDDGRIRDLLAEATDAGDLAQQLLCRDALREPKGMSPAVSCRMQCARVIADAEDMDDT